MKKSVPASSAKWVRMKADQVVVRLRSGAGGRPRISREGEQLIVRMAKENRDWGYDRIAGALANLGYQVCDQTVGNVLSLPFIRSARCWG